MFCYENDIGAKPYSGRLQNNFTMIYVESKALCITFAQEFAGQYYRWCLPAKQE